MKTYLSLPYLAVTTGILIIGLGDYVTGWEVSFGIFYLFPVIAAAWLLDERAALVAAALSGVLWLLADMLSGHPYSNPFIPYWNASVRLGMFGAVAVAIARLRTVQAKQVRLIHDLQEALAHVRVLSDLLPICAWCKKIRDDKGYWEQVDTYIQRHTGTRFTHGMCPECASDARKTLEEPGRGDEVSPS